MRKIKPIGIIDPERLSLMPESCHAEHEFCFRLHDQMAALLVEGERRDVGRVVFSLQSEEDRRQLESAVSPIDYLLATGKDELAQRVVKNAVTVALFSDFLHFIYEALRALEKRKFAVAFTLLRKPLRENLMFATWLKGDAQDFYDKLKENPAEFMKSAHFSKERRIELFENAIARSKGVKEFLDADLLYTMIYDRRNKMSFAAWFDRATHLVTSHRDIRTLPMDLNLIFADPMDDVFYEHVYEKLIYVLMYANLLMISLYAEMSEVHESYLDYIMITGLGAYSSLFAPGRNRVADEMNRLLRSFMNCPHCGAKVRVRKGNAARFFIAETLDCRKCGLDHHFPLHWLLSKTEFRVT